MFSPAKSLAAVAVLAIGASSATAFAADSANVTPQKTIKAGQISPVRIPGTKVRKGTVLRSNQALVSAKVLVANGATVHLTLTCPGTKKLQGIGPSEGGKAFFNLDQRGLYVGKHAVKLRADADKDVPAAHGTIYGLCQG